MTSDPESDAEQLENSRSLARPLLGSQGAKMKKPVTTETVATKDAPKTRNANLDENYLKGRIYANNAPKIFLETITARTATAIIVFTYLFFLLGFSIDFVTIYRSFTSNDLAIPSYYCSPSNANLYDTPDYIACAVGPVFNGTIKDLSNVISIRLTAQRVNLTRTDFGSNDTVTIKYNAMLWACGVVGGCSDRFQTGSVYSESLNNWQKVLFLSQQSVDIDLNKDLHSTDEGLGLNLEIFPNTFQNQEAIPSNGVVKSYFISLYFLEDYYNLFTQDTDSSESANNYYFDVVTRPRAVVQYAFNVVLLIVTVIVLVLYAYVIESQNKKSLPEQKWLIAYFFLLILFQNPIYCVIVWFDSPSIDSAYSCYVLDYLAQSGLFVLWLMFADSVNRKKMKKRFFYGPKIFFGTFIFTVGIVVLTFQFPGVGPSYSTDRSSLEAVANWSHEQQVQFIVFSLMYLILLWIWAIAWFGRLLRTRHVLKKLPYMSTRYLQLSYRFFFLQATLVTLYYVLQYAAVIYYISNGVHDVNTKSLTDDINTLFRQQTQLFGKTLFLTVYALILAFLFLPSNLMASNGFSVSVAATYVITEEERKVVVRNRRRFIKNMHRNLINQVTLVNQLINAKEDVFCVDVALFLRTLSYQAYYDPLGAPKTASSYEGEMDIAQAGFTTIDMHYDDEHEAFCFICRETSTGRIAVCFRGTASKRQMEDNLNYRQRFIDFNAEKLLALNNFDGLHITDGQAELVREFTIEEVNEDEDDEQHGDDIEATGGQHDSVDAGSSNKQQRRHSHDHGRPSDADRNNNAGGSNIRDTMIGTAVEVERGLKKAVVGAVDATNQGLSTVVGATTGLFVNAASVTPGLKSIVKPYIHSGFWDAYLVMREFVHGVLRRELRYHPTTVFFTGHSLGGALAAFAALDVTLHTIPRVNEYLKYKAKLEQYRLVHGHMPGSTSEPIHESDQTNNLGQTLLSTMARAFSYFPGQQPAERSGDNAPGIFGRAFGLQREGRKVRFSNQIKVEMYNFGGPRIGNNSFAQFYNHYVPKSYRVVVDGDLIPAIPPSSFSYEYTHIGTYVLIDSVGAGSIIIDPSFVERWLRTQSKSSVAVHSLLVYRKGLLGIKLAAEFMREYASDYMKDDMDPLRLALNTGHLISQRLNEVINVDDSTLSKILDNSRAMHVEDMGKEDYSLHFASDKKPSSKTSDLEDQSSSHSLIRENRFGSKDSFKSDSDDQLAWLKEAEASDAKAREADKYAKKMEKIRRANDAKHYQHDVRQMETLMSQIKTLKQNSGPSWWLNARASTINLGKSSMFGGSSKSNIGNSGPKNDASGSESVNPLSARMSDASQQSKVGSFTISDRDSIESPNK